MSINIERVQARLDGLWTVNPGPDEVLVSLDPARDDPHRPALIEWLRENMADPYIRSPEEVLAAERAQMRASRFQARAALHMAGLLAGIEAAVAQADPIVQIAWADAAEWRRDSPALIALAGAVGLADEDIDALFRSAMQIVA